MRFRRGRVLIVEDDAACCRAFERALRDEHEVTTASDGADALHQLAERGPFDVILCDIHMPVIDGISLHQTMLRIAPEHARRMAFLTGASWAERVREFLAAIPNRHLAKPFDVATLHSLVNDMLAAGRS